MKIIKYWKGEALYILLAFLVSSCGTLTEFKAQRPSEVSVPKGVKRIFIDPALIKSTNDQLRLKIRIIEHLKQQLNQLGRFQVTVAPVGQYDPNRETVAIIQGEIISGGEVDQGQFTEVGSCAGSLAGLAGSAASAKSKKQGVTFSFRGLPCVKSTITGKATEIGAKAGLGLLSHFLKVDINLQKPALDEVVRVYKYKNYSLFAQTNFSFTLLGKQQETLTIRSDAASFSRHKVTPESYRNVNEAAWSQYAGVLPVMPLVIRREAVAYRSEPAYPITPKKVQAIPDPKDLPIKERRQIVAILIEKAVKPFIRAVSPYQVSMQVAIDTDSDAAIVKLLEKGKFPEAQKKLQALPQKSGADLYNLGLTYEANAVVIEDYEDAYRFYSDALEKEPESEIYAKGIGRMEYRLLESKKLRTER